MKKILVILIVLVTGVAFMTYLYFSKLSNENNAKDLALQSATNNAALIFAFQNDKSFYQIIEGQNLIQQVLGAQKNNLLKSLKSYFVQDPSLNGSISNQEIYLSVLPDEEKTLNFLITVQIQPDKTFRNIFNLLKNKYPVNNEGNNIYKVSLNDSLALFIGIQNQVITASTSKKLIIDAAVRLTENPFTEYIKLNNTQNKNVLGQIYINYNKAPLLLKNILAGNISGEISVLDKQNSFASLSYNFSKEKILFNGTTELKDADNYLKLFEQIPNQDISITNILPYNTANYTVYAFDKYENWRNKLSAWQASLNDIKKTENVINSVKNDYRVDLSSIFNTYTKNQFICFQLSTAEKLGAISLSNGEKVKQLLLDVSTDYNDEIKVFKQPEILYAFFGAPLKKFSRPYYTIIDNNLVFANNASTIESFLNSYKNNKLLINEQSYLEALNLVSSQSNVSFYVNGNNSKDIFRSNVLLPYYKHLRADSGLKRFDTFYYQMSADGNKFITNLLLNKYLKSEIPDTTSNR
ncbi:hypothetical protein QWY86_18905 [Pedobacter aquatilis]|uniref:hypothetical protein n=1 Tax=Pedobacter aquatilis TaxID=351343 RepID=UPI0025B2E519|nr:hypothetical protein [Pedobacter aquatilis]MDN3588759.1 hypothetical protein [Pedobacter aquatilis]